MAKPWQSERLLSSTLKLVPTRSMALPPRPTSRLSVTVRDLGPTLPVEITPPQVLSVATLPVTVTVEPPSSLMRTTAEVAWPVPFTILLPLTDVFAEEYEFAMETPEPPMPSNRLSLMYSVPLPRALKVVTALPSMPLITLSTTRMLPSPEEESMTTAPSEGFAPLEQSSKVFSYTWTQSL